MEGQEKKHFSNIALGFISVAVGFLVIVVPNILALLQLNSPEAAKRSAINFIAGIGFLLGIAIIFFGVIGFWIIRPAYQRWWADKRYLVWIFIMLGILLMAPLFILILKIVPYLIPSMG